MVMYKRKVPAMDAADFDSIFGTTSGPVPEKKEIPEEKKELAAKITVEEAEAARAKAQAILEGNKKAIKRPILTTKEDVEDKSLVEEPPQEDSKPVLEPVKKAPSEDDFETKVKEILEKDYGPVTEDMYTENESEVSARIISNIGTDNEEPTINSEQLKEEQEAKKQEFIANKDLEGLEQYMLQLHIQRSEMIRNAKLKEKIMAEYERKVKKNATRKRTVAKAPTVETNDTTEEGAYTQEEEEKAEVELQKLEQERLKQLQQEESPKATKVVKAEKPKPTPKKAVPEPQPQEEFKLPFDDGLSIEDALTVLMQDYISEDFIKWQQDILNALAEIRIDPDINAGTMKFKLSQIDALRAELIGTRLQAKATLNTLMNKEYGMIAAYIAQNSTGSNSDERKKAGYAALESYRNSEGKRINLLKFFTGVRMRAEFIDTVIDELENKQRMLITYASSIKIDAQLTQ